MNKISKTIKTIILFTLVLSFLSCSKPKNSKVDCSEVCAIQEIDKMNKIFENFSTEKQFDFAASCTGEASCCGDSNCIGFSSWVIRKKGIDSVILKKLENEENKDAQMDFLQSIIILNNNHELVLKGRHDISTTIKKVADEMTNEPFDIIKFLFGEKTRFQETQELVGKINEKVNS